MGNNEWVSTTLGELVDTFGGSVQTGPFGSQLHAADYVSEGIPSVMPKNIKIEEIDVEDIAKVSLSDAERLKKYQLVEGDIVYSRRGDVEKCALVTKNEANWLCGTGCLRIRIPRNKSITPYFLHAFLSTPVTREWISRHAIGATMPNLNTSILRDVPIVVPPFDSMNFIGAMWIKLNRKIILNRKINQTLEQMSQTLFKSWFVDFDPVIDNALDAGNPIPEALQSRAELRQKERNSADFKPLPVDIRALFPAEFEQTELGCLPATWIYSDLNKLIDIKHGFAFKGEYFSEKSTNDIVLTPGNVRIGGGFRFDKFKYYKGEIPKDYVFENDDIFVSMTDLSKECDSLGYAARIPLQKNVRFLHNQRLGRVFIGKHASSVKEFIYQVLISKNYRSTVLGSVTGTTVKHTSPSKILSHIIPHSINGEVERKFNSICSSHSLSISKNNENNRILLQLRNTLLPKLISGELSLEDLPDLIKQTEAA